MNDKEFAGRWHLEEELQESEQRYQKLVEILSSAVIVHSAGKIVFSNKTGAKLLGFRNPQELVGRPVMDFVHTDYKEIVRKRIKQLYEERETLTFIEQKLVGVNGTVINVKVASAPLTYHGKPAAQAVIHDITGNKLVENKLLATRHQLMDIIEFLPDATLVIDKDKKVVFWNRAIEEMTGVNKEDIIGKGNYAYAEPFYGEPRPILIDLIFDDDKIIQSNYGNFRRIKNILFAEKYTPFLNKGKGACLWGTAAPLLDSAGNLAGAIETIRNITSHRQIENALRLSEERFSKAFRVSPAPMSITSFTDGQIIDVNESFLCQFEYRRDEVIGRTTEELGIWFENDVCKKIVRILDERGAVQNLETGLRTKSGKIWIGLYSAEITDLNGKQCILSLFNDITERRQFEKEMARFERLKLIGEMAAGIGHEIRNPMTTTRGFLQILKEKKECIKYREYFELMIAEMDRANSIITEFLSLAKDKTIHLEQQNLNTLLKALAPLIQADAKASKKIFRLLLQEIPDLFLDEKEIRQLILNLVRNGLESMSSGGMLTISTFTDDEEVVLAVADQGIGIAPDLLENIGTPFLTTKDYGTGLGLAVCYSIATRHEAVINVETGPEGTTFYIRFKKITSDSNPNEFETK
jgi:PAS domain S-box-containing protein